MYFDLPDLVDDVPAWWLPWEEMLTQLPVQHHVYMLVWDESLFAFRYMEESD